MLPSSLAGQHDGRMAHKMARLVLPICAALLCLLVEVHITHVPTSSVLISNSVISHLRTLSHWYLVKYYIHI